MKCERCGSQEAVEQLNGVVICDTCVILVLKEDQIRRREFGELQTS